MKKMMPIVNGPCVYCDGPADTHFEEEFTWVPACQPCLDAVEDQAREHEESDDE